MIPQPGERENDRGYVQNYSRGGKGEKTRRKVMETIEKVGKPTPQEPVVKWGALDKVPLTAEEKKTSSTIGIECVHGGDPTKKVHLS